MNTVKIRSTYMGGLVCLGTSVLESELPTDCLAHEACFTTATTGECQILPAGQRSHYRTPIWWSEQSAWKPHRLHGSLWYCSMMRATACVILPGGVVFTETQCTGGFDDMHSLVLRTTYQDLAAYAAPHRIKIRLITIFYYWHSVFIYNIFSYLICLQW